MQTNFFPVASENVSSPHCSQVRAGGVEYHSPVSFLSTTSPNSNLRTHAPYVTSQL